MDRSLRLERQDRIGAAVLLLTLLFASCPAHGQGRVYWVEPEQSLIKSVDIQGNNPQVIAEGLDIRGPNDLDADRNGWVYWTDADGWFGRSGRIGRSRPDGSDPEFTVSGIPWPYPFGIAVDKMNDHVYWTEEDRIRRSSLDGSGIVEILTSLDSPKAIEVFPERNMLFWSLENGGTWRAGLDGSGIVKVADAGNDYLTLNRSTGTLFASRGNQIVAFGLNGEDFRIVVDSLSQVRTVSTDEGANRLCWSFGGHGYPTGVSCSKLDGSDASELVSTPVPVTGMSIDPTTHLMTMVGHDMIYGRLFRCRHDGSGLERLGDPVTSPVDLTVDPVDEKMYWVDPLGHYENLFWRASTGGTEFESLWYSPSDDLWWSDVVSVAVDPVRRRVYLGGWSAASIFAAGGMVAGPLDGPINETILGDNAQRRIYDIAVDPNTGHVYYSDFWPVGHGTSPRGEIRRIDPDGSSETVIIEQGAEGAWLALYLEPPYSSVRASRLFWARDTEIWSSRLDGSDRTLVIPNADHPTSLGADPVSRHIFWLERDTGALKRARPDGTEIKTIATAAPGARGMAVVSSPSAVALVYPAPLAEDLPTSLMLDWNVPGVSGRSEVQVARADDTADIVFALNTPHSQAWFDAPEAGAEYLWRARFVGAGGAGPWTTWSKFSVGASGDLAVSLVSPDDGAAGVAIPVALGWTDAPSAVRYRLQVSDSASFDSVLVDVDTLTATSYELGGLEHEKTYFWRVAGVGESGSMTFSQSHSFATVMAAPQAVTLVSPAAGEEGVPAYAEFSWQADGDAESYRLEVATDSLFSQLIVSLDLTKTSFAFDVPLDYDAGYFWRVRASNAGGNGPWSDVRAFRTAVGTGVDTPGLPSRFALRGNYPNPFSGATRIGFDLPVATNVRLVIFDALGHEVGIAVDRRMPAGRHEVVFDGSGLPSAAYIARIEAGSFMESRVLTIVR